MKVIKGSAGYLEARRKQLVVKALLEFGIVLALLALGIWQTKTRNNLLTVVAVVGCLPSSKALVELITIFPHRSIAERTAGQIAMRTKQLTTAYDLVFTSQKNIMPVDSILILDNTICGYTSSKKTDAAFAGKHIRQILEQNQFTKVSVKIFTDYDAFLDRAESMERLAEENRPDTRKKEESIRQIILNISL